MKENIKNALKTEYAKMGLGDKAFDGVASFLAKTITKEEEIDGVIKSEDTKNLLKAFQGESDSLRNRAAQLEKDFNAYKEAHPAKSEPDTDPSKKNQEPEPEWARTIREQNEKILKMREDDDKKAKAKATISSAIAAAKAAGCNDEKVLKLTERLFVLKDGESDEDAGKRFESEYNANAKEYFGNSGFPRFGTGLTTPAEVSAEDRAAKAREDAKNARASMA